jgi:diguanylate cyclase (GGDEF)-like protein
MGNFFNTWRYYSFGKEQYQECMGKVFVNNLNSLRQVNFIIAVFAAVFSLFPIFFEMDIINKGVSYGRPFINAIVYLSTALIALLLGIYINYKMQTTIVGNKFIYVFTTLFYVNVMGFGIYLGVWSTPDKLATIFLCFLICALLMFLNPPQFNLILTLCAMAAYLVLAFLIKNMENAIYDTMDTLVAGLISLFFTWHISKLRLGLEISTSMLEDERDKYIDQSTIDELTKLKNRRDFMQTFKRYLSNYRTNDDWLCVSISDIDFFKFYNDHYGHPKGDDCLRSVGAAFNKLRDDMNVYVARVGGEEFAMLWFEKETSHVDAVVSYLSGLIRNAKIPHEKSKVNKFVTMSMGVYVEKCGASTDAQTLYNLADQALYAAKEGGRNCAVISGREIVQYKITPGS